MPLLSDEELKTFPEPSVQEVVPRHVARYWDLMALANHQCARVIGENAVLVDKPGFEVDFLTRGSIPDTPAKATSSEVLMPVRGHWRVTIDTHSDVLAPGDTCLVPAESTLSLTPSMTGEASLYRIRATDDPAGTTWRP
jgi:mannose-6-phosphate isomerase-like protein (cupin superfamily)